MPRFRMRDRLDPVDGLLRDNRRQPRDEYVASMLARLEAERGRLFRPRALGRRVLLAAVVTVLAFGAAVAAGGVQSASSGFTVLVDVAKKSVSSPHTSSGQKGTANGTGKSSHDSTGKSSDNGTSKSNNDSTGKSSDNGTSKSNNDSTSKSKGNGKGKGNDGSKGNDNHGKGSDDAAAEHQYAVAVCHHTSSAKNPWVEIHVSPREAAGFVAHHRLDFIVDANHPCPTKHETHH
jgi:hypothetical protein